jgi:hypothetical protein
MATDAMEDKGLGRIEWRLGVAPPLTYRVTSGRGGGGAETPVFVPYKEILPLQSGYYSYVLDSDGQFRIKRGHTSTHASMVRRGPVAAAGRFRVNRAGRVIEVFCESTDYPLYFKRAADEQVVFIRRTFANHPALNTNPEAVFRFKRFKDAHLVIDASGMPILDVDSRIEALNLEGAGEDVAMPSSPGFDQYVPEKPPRRYGMHADQSICDLEDDGRAFQIGDCEPRLAPGVTVPSGKMNFVIDLDGFLIVGPIGHQLLSGGAMVGGAGHIHIELSGEVSRLDLNFSGHYRPTLTADYACYVYRLISTHPLLRLRPDCIFAGRKFEGMEAASRVMEFTVEDLRGENPDLDFLIEIL